MKGLLLNGDTGELNEMIARSAWRISQRLYRGFGIINTAPPCGACETGLKNSIAIGRQMQKDG